MKVVYYVDSQSDKNVQHDKNPYEMSVSNHGLKWNDIPKFNYENNIKCDSEEELKIYINHKDLKVILYNPNSKIISFHYLNSCPVNIKGSESLYNKILTEIKNYTQQK